MRDELRQLARSRAEGRCEYCKLPIEYDPLPFCIDHIRAQYHHGQTVSQNLALACFNCNTFKGTNIAGMDPTTHQLTRLFHPRQDDWHEHFTWDGPVVVGRTPIGRATVDVLRINLPDRVEHRRSLIEEGVFPGAAP